MNGRTGPRAVLRVEKVPRNAGVFVCRKAVVKDTTKRSDGATCLLAKVRSSNSIIFLFKTNANIVQTTLPEFKKT